MSKIESMTPQDYLDFRIAHKRAGNDKEVREFIAARDAAEIEAEPRVRWVRNPNFRRFDQI